jgi:hypothetical protein
MGYLRWFFEHAVSDWTTLTPMPDVLVRDGPGTTNPLTTIVAAVSGASGQLVIFLPDNSNCTFTPPPPLALDHHSTAVVASWYNPATNATEAAVCDAVDSTALSSNGSGRGTAVQCFKPPEWEDALLVYG